MIAGVVMCTKRRSRVLAAAAGCWLLLVVLALVYGGDRRAGVLDRNAADLVSGVPGGVLRVLRSPTDPPLLIALVLLAAAVLWLLGMRRHALLLVLAPVVAVLLVDVLLKPLIGRRYEGSYLCLPSGHTAAAVSVFTVLLLVAWSTRWRWLGVLGWLLLTLAAGIALIGYGYHYLTDVAGGVCVAAGTVLPLSLVRPPGR